MVSEERLKVHLSEQETKGLDSLRPWLVDRIKRRAIRQLHHTRRGEVLLLRMYLIGECATEATLKQQLLPSPPEWLEKQMAWHLAEEQAHVRIFAKELARHGDTPTSSPQPDWISRRKIEKWKAIGERYTLCFQEGILVPAYAIGLVAEQMARRVLTRHSQTIADNHSFQPILNTVLRDEEKHIRLCRVTLERIVLPSEQEKLASLLREVRAVERSWGIRSSIMLYLTGIIFRVIAWLPERRQRKSA